MLWRLTGSQQAAQNPALASVLSRAKPDADSLVTPATSRLRLVFPQGLNQLIKEYGLPYWPPNRPKYWCGASSMANGPAQRQPPGGIKARHARRHSLGIPQYDSEDRTALSAEQFKALDSEALLNASFRYSLDTVMAVVISDGGSRWQIDHRGEKRAGDNAVQGINVTDFHARYAGGTGSSFRRQHCGERGGCIAGTGIGDYLTKHSLVTACRLL